MIIFLNFLKAEALKVRRLPFAHLIWLFPLIFVLVDFSIIANNAISTKQLLENEINSFNLLPITAIRSFWVGIFYPLLLALIPPLFFNIEHHPNKLKHLYVMPGSPKMIFLCKSIFIYFFIAICLLLAMIGLRIEWKFIELINPIFSKLNFPWLNLAKTMCWLFIGSLPVLSIYFWASQRIISPVVPILFGLVGLVFNIALSGHECDPSWKRDLIPWVLPYSCAHQPIDSLKASQQAHIAGAVFGKEIDLSKEAGTQTYYLPSGRRVTTTTTIPDYYLLPPPPTPPWMLATFSLVAGAALFCLGLLDARRNHT